MPRLTKTFVDDIQKTEKDVVYWDETQPGFGLRVKPTGAKSFCIQYRDQRGKSCRVTIGAYGRITLEMARKEARQMLASAELGRSPRAERDELRKAPTLAELAADFMKESEAGLLITRFGRPKSESTVLVDRGRIEHHLLPLLGKKLVKDITRQDVAALMKSVTIGKTQKHEPSTKPRGRINVSGGRGTAKKCVLLLSAILSYGIDRGLIDTNVARGIQLPKDKKRTVNEPELKLRAVGAALRLAEEKGDHFQAIEGIRLSAFTGMRLGEVVNLTWGQVDFDRRALRLVETKTDDSIRPMNCEAFRVLRQLYGISRDKSATGYVLPAVKGGDHGFGGMPRAIERILRNPDLRPDYFEALADFSHHSFRHAISTIANMEGASEITIAAMIGHTKGGVTAGYVAKVDQHLLNIADRTARRVARLMREGAATQTGNDTDMLPSEDFEPVEVADADVEANKLLAEIVAVSESALS